MDMKKIKRLVGDATEEQLRFVDCYVTDRVAMFMPACGACFFALTPLHTHPSYMFVLSFNDRTSIVINDEEISARPGKLLALSPDIKHHELPGDSPPRYIAVFIDKEFFEGRVKAYPVDRGFAFHGEYYDCGPNLLALFKRFMAEASANLPGSEDVLSALGSEITHAIIREVFHIAPPVDTLSTRLEVDRAIEYIHEHISEKLALKDMAEAASMSPSHFTRVFKKEVGSSPADYLASIRLEKARRLLIDEGRTITDVALECGFGSSSYFSDRFSRKYGLSPSEYKTSLEKGGISK